MSRVFRAEELFDAEREAELKDEWPEAMPILSALRRNQWQEVYPLAKALFNKSRHGEERACVLHWAVAASEMEYDLVRREKLLSLWSEIPHWAEYPYCSYLKTYHDGLTRFFAGSLREAEAYFLRALRSAEQHGYDRGIMVCLFHLGLVEFDRGLPEQANRYFEHARDLAYRRGARRFLARVEGKIAETKGLPAVEFFADFRIRFGELVRAFQFQQARELLLGAEIRRRKLRYGRRRESLGAYLALLFCVRGRSQLGNRLLVKIADPALKRSILEWKQNVLGLASSEEHELELLRDLIGTSRVVFRPSLDPASVEVAGKQLAQIKSRLVRNLIFALLKSEKALSKEEIVKAVWGLEYDPVIHDQKIYQLIFKAKKIFGCEDLFLNSYGFYEINPRLFGKAKLSA